MKMLSKVFSAVPSIAVTHLQPPTKDNKQKLTAHPMDWGNLCISFVCKIYLNVTTTVLTKIYLENAADTTVPSNPNQLLFFFFYKSCLKLHITLDEQPVCTRSLIKLIPIWIQVWDRTFLLNLAQLFCQSGYCICIH